jgi:hypothetical protein
MARSRWIITLILMAAALLLMSCILPVFPLSTGTPGKSILEVDIDYTGSWYVDTFDYSREAENIRHFVLIVPESEASRADAGWIFTSVVIQPDGSLSVRDDRQDYAWGLDYLYEAPQGYFEGEFEPGTYAVAGEFIAGPLSREEAGAGEDAILWAGVTGGGASSEYEMVTLDAGATTSLNIPLTDANGWACPWLYVFNGTTFERRTEILRHLRGKDQARTEITPLGPVTARDGAIVIRIVEEKDEVTYLDALVLLIDGVPVFADQSVQVNTADGDYLILRRGESVELRFQVPASFATGDSVSVIAAGYYLPYHE